MLVKNTPGPWKFFERDTLLAGNTKGNNQIARVKWLSAHKADIDANARLITAGPEMLEALQGAYGILTQSAKRLRVLGDDTNAKLCEVQRGRIKDIIEKAIG